MALVLIFYILFFRIQMELPLRKRLMQIKMLSNNTIAQCRIVCTMFYQKDILHLRNYSNRFPYFSSLFLNLLHIFRSDTPDIYKLDTSTRSLKISILNDNTVLRIFSKIFKHSEYLKSTCIIFFVRSKYPPPNNIK